MTSEIFDTDTVLGEFIKDVIVNVRSESMARSSNSNGNDRIYTELGRVIIENKTKKRFVVIDIDLVFNTDINDLDTTNSFVYLIEESRYLENKNKKNISLNYLMEQNLECMTFECIQNNFTIEDADKIYPVVCRLVWDFCEEE